MAAICRDIWNLQQPVEMCPFPHYGQPCPPAQFSLLTKDSHLSVLGRLPFLIHQGLEKPIYLCKANVVLKFQKLTSGEN